MVQVSMSVFRLVDDPTSQVIHAVHEHLPSFELESVHVDLSHFNEIVEMHIFQVVVREARTGKILRTLRTQSGPSNGVTYSPGARTLVPTGFAGAIPERACGLVLPRSGLALEHGITLANTPGLIDSGYRGELKVILLNTSTVPVTIERGQRVAQLLVLAAATRFS